MHILITGGAGYIGKSIARVHADIRDGAACCAEPTLAKDLLGWQSANPQGYGG
jgi:NAD(P)-dependent dehydrogenase (short-subunit alcohol dehydrogenase family)